MDANTKIFIALGAATAANCGPCFEHYFSEAKKLGVDEADVLKTVDIATKVRGGAHLTMKDTIQKILKNDAPQPQSCCGGASTCCDG